MRDRYEARLAREQAEAVQSWLSISQLFVVAPAVVILCAFATFGGLAVLEKVAC